jgi:hypothetical protein
MSPCSRFWSGTSRQRGSTWTASALSTTVEGQVAAAFDPLVVLFGQHGADEAGDGVAVGEDADDVGAAADLAVGAFLEGRL